MLVELSRQARVMLETEDPSSDPAVARLFPAAYPDDPLRNLEYEADLGGAPRTEKLEALDTLERTADADELSEEELLSWIRVVNDLRLVLGIRIDLTEGHTEEDYPEDDPRQGGYQVFLFLNEILYEMLVAAGAPEEDDLDPLEGG